MGSASLIPTVATAEDSDSKTEQDRVKDEVDKSETTVIKETDTHEIGIIETVDEKYVYKIDKKEGGMYINEIDSSASTVGAQSTLTTAESSTISAQATSGVELIKRGTIYRKKIGNCSLDSDCIHAIDGGSVELNKYLAGASKALLIAAIIKYLSARVASQRLAQFITSEGLKDALTTALAGIGTASLEGDSISLAMMDHDVLGEKLKASCIAVGKYKAGESALIEYFVNSGHVGCTDYVKDRV